MRGTNPNSLKNLLPRPPEGAQRKGALASNKAKKRKREIREITEYLLGLPVQPGRAEKIKNLVDAKTKNLSVVEAITIAQIKKAFTGDTKAYLALMDTAHREKLDLTPIDNQVSTDDRLYQALAERVITPEEPEGIQYEEDLEDASNQDAKTAESANV
jgi:hypothetical protein